MRKLFGLSAALALLVFVLPGLAGDEKAKGDPKAAGDTAKCACSGANATTVMWCAHCKKGMAFGKEIKSEKLVTALSGKEVKEADLPCADCKAALKSGGTCSKCKVAYVNGKAYKSPVAASLAKGSVMDKAKITCPGCKAIAEKGTGLCPTCSNGMVDGMVFKGKEDSEKAMKAQAVLAQAMAASVKCEDCAAAMLTDGTCDKCKATYKDGRKQG